MRCGTPGGYSLNHGYAPAPVEPVIASPVSARARRKIDFDYRKPPSAATLARQPVSQRRRLVAFFEVRFSLLDQRTRMAGQLAVCCRQAIAGARPHPTTAQRH